MARNGAGTYNLPAGNPVTTGTTISSTWANTTLSDMANALTGSLAADGQTTPTNNLPMGNYALTSVGNATVRNMYASAGQVQDGTFNYLTGVTGTNAILGSASMGMISYAVGQVFRFIAAASNTGASTLNINSIGAKPIVSTDGSALAAGSISLGSVVEVFYDGTSFQLMTDANGQSVFSTDITVHGLTVGLGNSSIAGNTAFGVSALGAITTGGYNTAIGYSAGSAITTGAKNTILGSYNGNQSGLDIRTSSNYIVLADGDANLRQVIDDIGNVGISVIPSNWSSSLTAIEVGSSSALMSGAGNYLNLSSNAYTDGAWKYKTTGYNGTLYQQSGGQHIFYTSPSGTAGSAITFTQAMTLDASSNLQIGGILKSLSYGTFAAPTIQLAENTYGFYVENGKLASKSGSGGYSWWDTTGSARSMTLNEYGILGLGVNPNTWSLGKAVEINSGGNALWSAGPADIRLTAGAYYDGAYKYGNTGSRVAAFEIGGGAYYWRAATSGTIGGTITFSEVMSLDENSNLTVAGQISGGYYAPAAGTTAMAFGSYAVTKVTPNATATFTTTVPAAGAIATLIILTSGTSSYVITFGSGFKTTGTLTTGTTSARNFVISFVSDGTNMLETSRTAAYAA